MAWITPKTDWKAEYDGTGAFVGDYVNIVDYNRIKNNLLYIWDMACAYIGSIPTITVGADKTYTDYYYADEWNLIENGLQVILDALDWQRGSKQTFYDNGKFINYTELNRIESVEKEVYDYLPKPEGHFVTYHVDTNYVMVKDIADGGDCISDAPVPTVTGLHGWREDTVASSSVLSSKTCDRDGIHLYAVLAKSVVASYNGNGNTGGSTASSVGTQYYNNGNVTNASVTLRANGYTKSGYMFTKWAKGSTSGTQYSAGTTVTLTENTVFYALWQHNSVTIETTPANFPNWSWGSNGSHTETHQTDPNGYLYVSAHEGGEDPYVWLEFTVNTTGYSKIRVEAWNESWGQSWTNYSQILVNGNLAGTIANQAGGWTTVDYNLPAGTTSATIRHYTGDFPWMIVHVKSITLYG